MPTGMFCMWTGEHAAADDADRVRADMRPGAMVCMFRHGADILDDAKPRDLQGLLHDTSSSVT